jgi:hypothetical protein
MSDSHYICKQLGIVDCTSWAGGVCVSGHDPSKCGTCAHRVPRPTTRRAFEPKTKPPQPAKQGLRGMGDVVAAVAKALGFKQKPNCGCSKRQEALNRIMPFTPG